MPTNTPTPTPTSMPGCNSPRATLKRRRRLAQPVATALAVLVLAACGGGGGGSATAGTGTAPVTPAAPARKGTLLTDVDAFYPRLIRLSHQASAADNGRILASVISFPGGQGEASIFASDDEGQRFTKVGAVRDNAWAPGLCCGSIFELPQAVGALPAGTLLWSASVGQETPGRPMETPVYKSLDAGRTWTRQGGCGSGSGNRGTLGGVWEPEFLLAKDGSLVCIFSDETQPTPDQNLMLTSTRDGISWSTPRPMFVNQPAAGRPGMAVVQRLGNGRYFLSYEYCGSGDAGGGDCKVYVKTSDNGLDWEPSAERGTQPRTAEGKYFRAAPTHAVLPGTDRVLLVGQFLNNSDGSHDAAGAGATLMLSTTADGSGAWRAIASPLPALNMPSVASWCPNYSSALLPSRDGKSVLMMASDFDTSDPRNPCRTWFATVTLPTN